VDGPWAGLLLKLESVRPSVAVAPGAVT